MAKCACGRDHEKDQKVGARAEYASRAERWGEPFELTHEGAFSNREPIELRVEQREDGAWNASVFRPEYAPIVGLDVGTVVFTGIAPTEARAQQLARDGLQGWIRARVAAAARRKAERQAAKTQ